MKTISARQAGIMLAITNFAGKLLLMPSLVSKNMQSEGIWSIIFLFICEIVILILMIEFLKKNPETTFYDFLQNKIGKILTKLIYIFIGIYFIITFFWIYEETKNFLIDLVYEQFDFTAFSIIVLISSFIIASNGLTSLARTFEIFILPIFFGLAVTICFSLFSGSFNSLLPLFDKGIPVIMSTSLKICFLFGEVFIFILLLGKIKIKKKSEINQLWIFYISSIIFLVIIFLLYISIYKYVYEIQTKALTDIVCFSPNIDEIGKINIVAIFTMITISFLHASMAIWMFLECINNVYSFKNKLPINAVLMIIIFILVNYVFYSVEKILFMAENIMNYYTISLSLLILVFISMGLFKNKKRILYEKKT